MKLATRHSFECRALLTVLPPFQHGLAVKDPRLSSSRDRRRNLWTDSRDLVSRNLQIELNIQPSELILKHRCGENLNFIHTVNNYKNRKERKIWVTIIII